MTGRRIAGASITAAAAALVLVLLGLQPEFAVGYGLLAGAAVLVAGARSAPGALDWPRDPERSPAGTRTDVARLGWSLREGRDGVGDGGVRRLRRLLVARLATAGVDASSPEGARVAGAVLGRAAGDLLSGRPIRLTIVQVEGFLDAIDTTDIAARVAAARPAADAAETKERT